MDADVLPARLAPDGERSGDLPILARDPDSIANIGNGHGTPADAPADTGTSEEPPTNIGDASDVPPHDDETGDVRLVAPDEPAPADDVRLVAQANDDEDMAGAVSASQLAHRRWRWERKKHGATWYYLLTTGRYYAKGNDTREYIYIGKEKGDPAGRARRAGVSLPHG